MRKTYERKTLLMCQISICRFNLLIFSLTRFQLNSNYADSCPLFIIINYDEEFYAH